MFFRILALAADIATTAGTSLLLISCITSPASSTSSAPPVTSFSGVPFISSHFCKDPTPSVELPNVGMSTLFNTLTKLCIPAMNFPFCTIEPNETRVYVPDERFDWLCQLFKPKSEVFLYICKF